MKYVCPSCAAINPTIIEVTIENIIVKTPLKINNPKDIEHLQDMAMEENLGDDGTVSWECSECGFGIPAYNDGELETWLEEQEEEHGKKESV